jgi:hypothetical protein
MLKSLFQMNTKDFLHLGVPLGQAARRATDFISKFILGGGDKSRLREEVTGYSTINRSLAARLAHV